MLRRTAKFKEIQSYQQKSQICEKFHHILIRTDNQTMVAGGAAQYAAGWICDKCERLHSDEHRTDPIFRCNICNIDVCETCQGARPAPILFDRLTYNAGYGYAHVPQQYFAVAPQPIPAMGSPQYLELPPIDNKAQQERYY
jgi:hypothetical protein